MEAEDLAGLDQAQQLAELLGRKLRAWRQALALDAAGLARAVGYERTTVAHAERGSQVPSLEFLLACQRRFGGAEPLLELRRRYSTVREAQLREARRQRRGPSPARATEPAPAWPAATWSSHEYDEPVGLVPRSAENLDQADAEGVDGTNRRQVTKLLLATAAGSVAEMILADGSAAASLSIEQLDSHTRHFEQVYLRTPPERISVATRALQALVTQRLQDRPAAAEERELNAVAARLASVRSYATFHLGRDDVADRQCETALLYAREAGERDLVARLLGTRAIIAFYDGRPRAALRWAQGGQAEARQGSSITVWLAVQEARALARINDASRAEDALHRAEQAFERLTERPSLGTLYSFNPADLPLYAGNCFVSIGRPREACGPARQAMLMFDAAEGSDHADPAGRALARLELSSALIQLGEPEEASRLAVEALHIYRTQRRTDSILRRCGELQSSLAGVGSIPAVRDFSEQYVSTLRSRLASSAAGA
jgi:transcriptional regulator with XRE-family HTH domain/tetratricopeptide (TPR) repeat protein